MATTNEVTSWEQLLAGLPGGLEWCPFIYGTGFGDFNWVVTLDSSHWEQMLDGVSAESERMSGGMNNMKMGHRMYITSRLGQEKLRRGTAARHNTMHQSRYNMTTMIDRCNGERTQRA